MSNTIQPQVEANLQAVFDLANLSFSQVERITELHLEQAKISAELAHEQLHAVLDVKDPTAALTLLKEQLETSTKSLAGFAATAFELAQEFQAEATQFTESHFDKGHAEVNKAINEGLKKAPQGSEAAVAAVKSAVEAGNKALSEARKAAKKSAELAQESIAKLKEHAPKATAKPAARRKARA